MKPILPALCLVLGSSFCAQAQLSIDNATLYIESGATVTVQGDVVSNANIQGSGKLLLKGTGQQRINMNSNGTATNAYTIPNLEIDNGNNVILTGNTRIGSSLLFTNGKIQAGNFNLVLSGTAVPAGMGAGRFVETDGAGFAQKEIGNAAAGNVLVPVGTGSTYTPLQLTHSGGTYNNALLGAQAKAGKSPDAHPRTESYTNVYWPVSTNGITGGTYTGTGTYPADDAPGFTGTENELRGMSFNGSEWSLAGSNQNTTGNTVTARFAGNSGQLVGMNRFLLLNSRVYLQGAYNAATGLMNDQLRSTDATQTPGTPSSNNLIPSTDPYRSAPYNTSFAHVNNNATESVAASVFNHQANPNDHIVDWVYLELRNTATSGNTVLQTRSALLQRDGDIVDIDGKSPVYFKNLDAADFNIGIRHRNHLGLFTNPAGFAQPLSLVPNTTLPLSTLAAASLMGTSGTNYLTNSGINLLYAGNVNSNTNIRYTGLSNDKDYLYNTVLSGNAGTVLSNVYNQGDLNLNRVVRYTGLANDKDFLYNTVLGSNVGAVKTQSTPQ